MTMKSLKLFLILVGADIKTILSLCNETYLCPFHKFKAWLVYVDIGLVFDLKSCRTENGHITEFRKCIFNCSKSCKYLNVMVQNSCLDKTIIKNVTGRISVPCDKIYATSKFSTARPYHSFYDNRWNLVYHSPLWWYAVEKQEKSRLPLLKNIWKFKLDSKLKLNITFLHFNIGTDRFELSNNWKEKEVVIIDKDGNVTNTERLYQHGKRHVFTSISKENNVAINSWTFASRENKLYLAFEVTDLKLISNFTGPMKNKHSSIGSLKRNLFEYSTFVMESCRVSYYHIVLKKVRKVGVNTGSSRIKY